MVDSDGTLILHTGKLVGGTALTVKLAKKREKPYLIVQLDKEDQALEPEHVLDWIARNGINKLNVAGNRESKPPGIYQKAFTFMVKVLSSMHTK